MAKRSISDSEIALIKAMLAQGIKNKDIQFRFNRPDRPVNAGRISSIKSGSYGGCASVKPATKEALAAFLAGHVTDTATNAANSEIPLFKKSVEGFWVLVGGENEQAECKLLFDPKKLSPVIRAVAGLANNKGGTIFFGIADKTFKLEGVGPEFAATDIVKIVDKVKAHLTPTPSITIKDCTVVGGISVGFLRVEKHSNRPIIVYRDGEDLHEGDILFRYAGQTARIKFGDLRSMLEERDMHARSSLIRAASHLAEVGPENALILDVGKGEIAGAGRQILIDEKLLEKVRFIKEGQFDEVEGAPTLKLVGSVSAVPQSHSAGSQISKQAILQDDILEEFLSQTVPGAPLQYIQAGLGQPRHWLPIFYFARLAKMTNAQAAAAISSGGKSHKGKRRLFADRFLKKKSAYSRPGPEILGNVTAAIAAGNLPGVITVKDVYHFCAGLAGVKKTTCTVEELLSLLIKSRKIIESNEGGDAMSYVFKAACRVDELFFGADT